MDIAKNTIFISFFTKNGKYPELAKKLKKSLLKFNLEYDIKAVEPFPSWIEGTHFKPKLILDLLLQYRKNLVFLDIDTEIWKMPELLFGDHDFAIYNWLADKNHHLENSILYDPKSKQLLGSGGVMKFGYTAPAINLLINWIRLLPQNPTMVDDQVLDKAFNTSNLELNTLWLPKIYNRMDKHSSYWSEIPNEEVVINHDFEARSPSTFSSNFDNFI